jgi:hypothetical protein
MTTDKRKLYLLSVALIVILLSLLVVLALSPKKPKGLGPKDIEKGNVLSVGIQNTEKLNQVLLDRQFQAIRQALSSYIQNTYGKSVLSAEIVAESTVVNNDGSINFSVKIDKPAKTFSVVLQRPNSTTIIFSVPESNSEPTVLYPYNNP